jgi:hypothetical protein
MTKHILFPIVLVLILIAVVGLFVNKYGGPGLIYNSSPQEISPSKPSKVIKVRNVEINVEVANTQTERAKGLSERNSLDENSGMLFDFGEKNVSPGFWMKGMRFPLDIIWIKDNSVLKIDKNVPAPASATADSELPLYRPSEPIDYVLEVNAGFSDKKGIKPGDQLTITDL